MLSNNVWSVSEERAKRQKRMRKRVRSRGHFARLIQPREIRKNFNFCSDSLAETLVLSYILPSPFLHPPSLSSFLSHCFWKTFLIKNPVRDLDLSVGSAERQIPTASVGSEGHPSIPLVLLLPFFLTILPTLYMPSVGIFAVYPLSSSTHSSIFSKERKKEEPAAALPTGKRRGSRFKSRIFRGRKATRLLKANKKRNAPLARSFFYFEERWRSFLRLHVDATEMYPWRREKYSLNHSSRSRETHLSAKLQQEIPAFISLLDIHVSRLCTRVLPKILDVRQLYVIIFVPSFKKLQHTYVYFSNTFIIDSEKMQ